VHAAELGLPGVVTRFAETVFPAQLLDWQPGIGFAQDANDLFFPSTLEL
jgi:hypothetical protein